MSREEKEKKSREILNRLVSTSCFANSENICIYVSTDGEVQTRDFIQCLLKDGDKNVLIPFIKEDILGISQINDFNDLVKGKFDILELVSKKDFEGSVDLIIVPGVGFDSEGNRLGKGKGYYDKLLTNKNIFKVGLAFTEQMVDIVPTEKHDIQMDMIITDKQIIHSTK